MRAALTQHVAGVRGVNLNLELFALVAALHRAFDRRPRGFQTFSLGAVDADVGPVIGEIDEELCVLAVRDRRPFAAWIAAAVQLTGNLPRAAVEQ